VWRHVADVQDTVTLGGGDDDRHTGLGIHIGAEEFFLRPNHFAQRCSIVRFVCLDLSGMFLRLQLDVYYTDARAEGQIRWFGSVELEG